MAKDLEFLKIHDLAQLVKICTRHDKQFKELDDLARELNPFYIETRYPGFVNAVDKSQAEAALKKVERIALFIKEKLPI